MRWMDGWVNNDDGDDDDDAHVMTSLKTHSRMDGMTIIHNTGIVQERKPAVQILLLLVFS